MGFETVDEMESWVEQAEARADAVKEEVLLGERCALCYRRLKYCTCVELADAPAAEAREYAIPRTPDDDDKDEIERS